MKIIEYFPDEIAHTLFNAHVSYQCLGDMTLKIGSRHVKGIAVLDRTGNPLFYDGNGLTRISAEAWAAR